MIKKDIVVLGGGASSLFMLATTKSKKDILVIDKETKLGKKILATGNGKCNLTNLNISEKFYNTSRVVDYFNMFNEKDTLNVFNNFGLLTYSDEENRVYPYSNTAVSVLECLKNQVELKDNIEIYLETEVLKVNKIDNGYIIKTDKKEDIFAKKIVIALGSKSSENILNDLKIKYIPFEKSLCALETDKNKNLSGIRVSNTNVTLKINGKTYKEKGEVLFKENGISGIVIFNLSRFVAYENNKKSYLYLDFMPNYNNTKLNEVLLLFKDKLQNQKVADFLNGILNKNLAKDILIKSKINLDKLVKNITNNEINIIINNIKNYKLNIKQLLDNNQVYFGGVELNNINNKMQYKYDNDIYIIGECACVDGACGGYNLQWAWTSGMIAGNNL